MRCLRNTRLRLDRMFRALIAALAVAAAPLASVQAAPVTVATSVVALRPGPQSVDDFYRARKGAPLWLSPAAGDSARRLIALLTTAELDGLDPGTYHVAALQQALDAARTGRRGDVDAADRRLSDAFVAYVRDLRRDPGLGILYVDQALKPAPPSPLGSLLFAAGSPSLSSYVREIAWMNPIYGELRGALADHKYVSADEKRLLEFNLERARALPAGQDRYILVNAAEQRLYTYDRGKQVDSMVVVVGKPKYPTPMMAAYVRFASLNPYWYVPPDLGAERIAPEVLKQGVKYLDNLGYKILSDWAPNAEIIDPKMIDWKAVAAGKKQVLMRQDPGPHNSMGRMKFMFPNEAGVYLHDNPERELFTEASRLYSGGCVRLEDAPRLGRWLFGHDLDWKSASVEQIVQLQMPVPVYITYLTAVPQPDGMSIAYLPDVYRRDKARLAAGGDAHGRDAQASR